MRAKLDDAQDIIVRLTKEELESQRDETNFANPLRAGINGNAYFLLGRTKIANSRFKDIVPLNGIQADIPTEPGDPYYVNVLDEAYKTLSEMGNLTVRLRGGSKLLIIVESQP